MRTIRNERYWPEYGAIFMANKFTREECFERKLFGLPYKFADFVMEVKIGMLLFLYDFEEKNLYGVFEAASDGAMNIIPDAYKSTSHMEFPAQVCFTTLWFCNPIPEHVFRDAIKENYYDSFKFNFGLSRRQVSRLLTLFENRIIKIPSSPVREGQDQKSSQMGKSVVVAHSCSLEISDLIKESIYELQESVLGMQDAKQKSNPDKPGNLDACELEQSTDYIPVPSIEPDEIEELPEVFQWDDMSFTEIGERLMKPLIWPLEYHSSSGSDDKRQLDISTKLHVQQVDSESSKENSSANIAVHKEIHCSIGTEVHGMYSDNSENRTSAFLRLSGLGKVMAEERQHHGDSKVDNLRDILKGLDMRRKLWDRERRSENVSKSDNSVFSRLGSYGQARERNQNVISYAGDVKHVDILEKSARQSYKRKSYDHFSRNEERNRSRYRSENYTGTKSSKYGSLDVPYFSDESCVCSLNRQ